MTHTSMRVPSTSRKRASHAGWAGHAGQMAAIGFPESEK